MEQFLTTTFEHAPALAAMVVIVILFLKFLKQMLELHAKRTDEFIAAIQDMHKESLVAREQSRAVIEHNTAELARNTTVMQDFNAAVLRVAKP